ncbi:hypothetical protein B9Z52_10150 [Limnohabitans sp. Jir72]|nr:hypothetical protein [Limnohabitans sp. Jir72]PUE31941.1 hypothetical protein B9Z52_10150 [Limnohabitans sp. Jir72]
MQKTVMAVVLAWAIVPAWSQAPSPQPAHKSVQAHAAASGKSDSKVQGKTHLSQAPHPTVHKAQAKASTQAVKATMAPLRKPVLPAALAAMPISKSHLSIDELAIAEHVHKGHLPCELGATVRVEADADQPGYFDVRGKGFHYHMHPVSTSTGAIRLEDKRAGAVWLQLANKSMLMDQVKGRRIADECAHPEQMAFAQDMKNNPPPKLFDTTGMGR